MKVYNICSKYLCDGIRQAVLGCDLSNAEEIRIRTGKKIAIKYRNGEKLLEKTASKTDLENIYGRLTAYSPYAFKEEINSGYITLEDGYRVGIAGRVIEENGNIVGVRNISSINIRIAREVKGCAREFVDYIKGNVLIVSPPSVGKTTFLRDYVRILSNNGSNISVIDERNEISATYMGITQLDVGERTDVIVNVSKSRGIEMALRALAPDIIAVDEIGGQADVVAIKRALNCGLYIVATVHAHNDEDILKKSGIKELGESKVFDTYVFLKKGVKDRVYKICDREMNVIWQLS